jgi:hypothetical protein
MKNLSIASLTSVLLATTLANAGGSFSGNMERIECTSKKASLSAVLRISKDVYSKTPEAYEVTGGAVSVQLADGKKAYVTINGFKRVQTVGAFYQLTGSDANQNDWILNLSQNPKDQSSIVSTAGDKATLSCQQVN